MRFVSAEHEGRRFAGVLQAERVVPIAGAQELDAGALTALLEDPPLQPTKALPLAEVSLLPPVPNPARILCVGLNYGTHVRETAREMPDYPVLFAKFASSLVGARDPIVCPPESSQVDYEAELAVIVGRPVRRVSRDRALHAVAGYAVANDVTMRDFQYKTHQWIQGKAWDRSTPLGPALVSADEVGDPGNLTIALELNGQVMQSANTADLIFDVATLICVISQFTALQPGDVILTGTPGGVGYRREPQVFLGDGDVVSVEISGLGRIENPVIAESAAVADAA